MRRTTTLSVIVWRTTLNMIAADSPHGAASANIAYSARSAMHGSIVLARRGQSCRHQSHRNQQHGDDRERDRIRGRHSEQEPLQHAGHSGGPGDADDDELRAALRTCVREVALAFADWYAARQHHLKVGQVRSHRTQSNY
jgi:hypothetical protein